MALWPRVKRVFRSFVGFFIDLAEDPELILKQNLRDLEDQLPMINENIAQVKATENLQRKEVAKLSKQEQELAAKIKAALKHGNRELALNFATTLDQVRSSKRDTEEQLSQTEQAYQKMLQAKRSWLQQKERKVNEIRTALNAKKKAEWQAKVADSMKEFAPATDANHDDMLRKIDEEAAVSEARLEIALEGANVDSIDIEAEASRMQANATLAEFEQELGLDADISEAPMEAPSEKTIGPRERELA